MNERREVPQFGMIQLERSKGVKEMYMWNYREVLYAEPKDFTDTFKDFCFASLYIKEEVIKALQGIRVECNNVLNMSIFNFEELPEEMRLEEFKHI